MGFTTKNVQNENTHPIFDLYLSSEVFPQINDATKIKKPIHRFPKIDARRQHRKKFPK